TLAQLQVNILAFDFRAHGLSDGRSATFGQRESLDLLAARAFMAGRHPDRPLALVGVSYGASVMLQTLPRIPEAKAVWLESPFVTFMHMGEHKLAALPAPLREWLLSAYRGILSLDCGFDADRCDAEPGLPQCK